MKSIQIEVFICILLIFCTFVLCGCKSEKPKSSTKFHSACYDTCLSGMSEAHAKAGGRKQCRESCTY